MQVVQNESINDKVARLRLAENYNQNNLNTYINNIQKKAKYYRHTWSSKFIANYQY